MCEFTKTDITRLTHGKFKRTEDVAEPLRLLEEYGYISTNFLASGGRPTEKICVNPQINNRK
ncbi:MAG: hypothetical protein LBN95_06145, partial [Prevotellaceae bacterium]|jgi:hypothetical protein|nr:hypothetical protein [Prevotellaceae bacterium]